MCLFKHKIFLRVSISFSNQHYIDTCRSIYTKSYDTKLNITETSQNEQRIYKLF